MESTVAGFAGWQIRARESPRAPFAVHADSLFLDDVGMTGRAVDRIKPAAMPPVIGANMALQALRAAMRRQAEVTEVVVTFEAGIGVLCCAERGGEQETRYEDGEGCSHDRVPRDFRGRGHNGIMRRLPPKRTESGSRYTRM